MSTAPIPRGYIVPQYHKGECWGYYLDSIIPTDYPTIPDWLAACQAYSQEPNHIHNILASASIVDETSDVVFLGQHVRSLHCCYDMGAEDETTEKTTGSE